MAQPLIDREVDVAHGIVAAMADAGIEFVLGIPGGLTGPIWRALYDHPTIRTILVREESLGSYMAEAYGRLRGRPMVLMGQGEWIVGNAAQGYMESLMGSSPMVILTEMTDGGPLSHHAVYQGGSGDFGAWDTRKALEGVTKRVMVSHHPAQAVQHVQLAVKHALTGDPGPVAVVFRSNALAGTVGPTSTPRLYRAAGYLGVRPPAPDEEDLDFVLDLLRSAERPVIVAGNGVRVGGACAELDQVARLLDIPVVTTAQGKGVVDERAPYAAGVMGSFGWPSANDVVGGADVVLAVGTKLGTADTIDETTSLIDPSRQAIIQVDVEPLMVGFTTPVARGVLADAARFLAQLAERNGDRRTVRPVGAADRVSAAMRADRGPGFTSDEVPLTPQRIIGLLNRWVPEDAVVTADAGENRLFMMRWYQSKRPGAYLQPGAGGGMGHAVPAALGAKVAFPDAPVVAVCGDGGFSMSIHGLMTAVEQNLPIAVVVLNNRALGWVLHGMGERVIAAEFADFDHAAIASSLGCDGVRVESVADLEQALTRLARLERPLVIDVPTGLGTSFRDILDPVDRRRSESGGY
jgi:acetolactate synthase-1/2/3 large subunit